MFGFGPAFAGLIRSDTSETYQISNREVEKAQFLARKRQDELDEIRVENDEDQLRETLHRYNSEWSGVFHRLDQADGQVDGKIDRKALVKWVSALDLQKTIDFEANLNISPRQLERLVSRVDANKDGYVDREEFLKLIYDRDKHLSKKQQSLLRHYLQVAAYAEEYSCWPPPIFIPCLTCLQDRRTVNRWTVEFQRDPA